MSGCHPPETLAVCKHGKPVKFPCLHCASTHSEFTMIDVMNAMEELRNRTKEYECIFIELRKEISSLKLLISKDLLHIKPHKCPVCDGTGNERKFLKNNLDYNNAMTYEKCNTCEGKGIVWG